MYPTHCPQTEDGAPSAKLNAMLGEVVGLKGEPLKFHVSKQVAAAHVRMTNAFWKILQWGCLNTLVRKCRKRFETSSVWIPTISNTRRAIVVGLQPYNLRLGEGEEGLQSSSNIILIMKIQGKEHKPGHYHLRRTH